MSGLTSSLAVLLAVTLILLAVGIAMIVLNSKKSAPTPAAPASAARAGINMHQADMVPQQKHHSHHPQGDRSGHGAQQKEHAGHGRAHHQGGPEHHQMHKQHQQQQPDHHQMHKQQQPDHHQMHQMHHQMHKQEPDHQQMHQPHHQMHQPHQQMHKQEPHHQQMHQPHHQMHKQQQPDHQQMHQPDHQMHQPHQTLPHRQQMQPHQQPAVHRFQEHMQGKIMSPDEDLPPMPSAKTQNHVRFVPQQPQRPVAEASNAYNSRVVTPPLAEANNDHAYNARFNMQRDPAPVVNTGEGTGVADAMWSRNTQFNQKPAMPGYVS